MKNYSVYEQSSKYCCYLILSIDFKKMKKKNLTFKSMGRQTRGKRIEEEEKKSKGKPNYRISRMNAKEC